MIIKAVWLHNIRSYKDEIVVFPEEGITVIYGDVGSGKTSILSAIGFAIFGNVPGTPSDPLSRFANPTARDLLRKGESRGFIRLWLKSGERNIVVHREIVESGTTVSDRGGWVLIVEKNGKTKYKRLTATEMRNYILETLGIPEEKTRARSRVFASAIYVPQFGIHSILNVSDKERLEIVNRVLNLIKYSYARERIDYVKKVVRRRIRENLEKRESELRGKIAEEEQIREELRRTKEELKRLEEELKELRRKEEEFKKVIEELEDKERRLREIAGKIGVLKTQLEHLKREKEREEVRLKGKTVGEIEKELKRKSDELEKFKLELEEVGKRKEEIEEERENVEKELERKIEETSTLTSKISAINGKVDELRKRLSEIEELERKGVCPVCLQPVTHAHAHELKSKIVAEIEELEAKKKQYMENLRRASIEVEKLKQRKEILSTEYSEIESRESKLNEKIKNLLETLSELKTLLEVAKKVSELEAKIENVKRELETVGKASKELDEVTKKLSFMKKEYDDVLRKKEELSTRKGVLQGKISNYESKLEEIEKLREELIAVRNEISKNKFYIEFLDKHVLAIIREVERYVKSKAYVAFKEEFLRIFKTLMMGYENIDVEITPDFKLQFKAKIDGTMVTIDTPSGGQLTSISLAYRLALNRVARAMIPQLREGILILDEPTYGFSPERVELLRKVLFSGEGPKQVIIVTHDRSFSDVSGEERLSIIRLELDPETTKTKIHYENIDPEYVEKVKNTFKAISKKIFSMSIEVTQPVKETFKPEVKVPLSEKVRKKTTSLLDFISQTGEKRDKH